MPVAIITPNGKSKRVGPPRWGRLGPSVVAAILKIMNTLGLKLNGTSENIRIDYDPLQKTAGTVDRNSPSGDVSACVS